MRKNILAFIFTGLCLVALVGFGVLTQNRGTAWAQGDVRASSYQTSSPHWSHINVLDFARDARGLTNQTKNQAFTWLAQHIDGVETSMDSSFSGSGDTFSNYLHGLNPSIKTFGYDYDITMCEQAHCNQADPTPHPVFTNLPEDYYLHFSQDTQIEMHDLNGATIGTMNITGCPSPQPITAACRVQVFMWTQKRWAANFKSTGWQQWKAGQFIQEMQTNNLGQTNTVDGLFLDEHGPGMSLPLSIGNQTKILSGGGIREYGNRVPSPASYSVHDQLDSDYNADMVSWLSYLHAQLSAAGKFARINIGDGLNDQLNFNQVMAIQGVMTEIMNRPDDNGITISTNYESFLDHTAQFVQAGGNMSLSSSPCATPPPTYTAGNYGSTTERYRMWGLANYYMARENPGDPGVVYYDSNLCFDNLPSPLDFENQWLTAVERDIGAPQGPYTVAKQGTVTCSGGAQYPYKIFSRQYGQALILSRVRDGWVCDDYSDATAIQVPLAQPMQVLHADGSVGPIVSTVSIRNAEAVVMVPPPDTTPPVAVSNLQAK